MPDWRRWNKHFAQWDMRIVRWDIRWEPGFVKAALYGSGLLYTHAARQIADGKWTSKLGEDVDIEHDTPEDVAGGIYGEIVEIMKRPIPAASS